MEGKIKCALKTDGSLWCWDRDSWDSIYGPTPVMIDASADFVTFDVEGWGAAGIKGDGSLWRWRHERGDYKIPSLISSDVWIFVDVTYSSTDWCAIKSDHSLWCATEIGTGMKYSRVYPVRIIIPPEIPDDW